MIGELERFERIRYPDRVLEEGMQLTVALFSAHKTATSTATEPVYTLALEEVDALVQAIFNKVSVNPAFFTGGPNPDAKACLEREPKSPLV